MKKGFTLVEVMATIIILGILALILVPIIDHVIERAHKASFRESVNNLIEAASNYISEYTVQYKTDEFPYPMMFACNGETCSNDSGVSLMFKGEIPVGGTIIMNSVDKIYASYVTNGKYCASGYKGKVVVGDNCDKADINPPTMPTQGSLGEVSGADHTGFIQTEASGSFDDRTSEENIIYKYLVTNDDAVPSKDDKRFSTSKTFERSCGTNYFGWAVAEDLNGNRSDVLYLGFTFDGENVYSEYGECTKSCGGGVKTRTNACALIVDDLVAECNTQGCSYPAVDESYAGTPACTNGRTLSNGNCTYYYQSNAGQCGYTSVHSCRDESYSYCVNQGYDSHGNWQCIGEKWATACCRQVCGNTNVAASCTKTENAYKTYTCNAGDTKDSSNICHHYTCPDGGILEGTTCVR